MSSIMANWHAVFDTDGIAAGPFSDRAYAWLIAKGAGVAGDSIQDMWYTYWNGVAKQIGDHIMDTLAPTYGYEQQNDIVNEWLLATGGVPSNAILAEDGTPILTESGDYILSE